MSQQINLYSENQGKRKGEFTAVTMALYLLVVIVAVLAYYGLMQYQTTQMASMLETGKKRLDEDQKRLLVISAEFSRKRAGLTLEQELKNVSNEAAAQKEILQALQSGNLGNATGYSQYMQAFARQIVSGVWLTGFSIKGDAMQMSLKGATLDPDLVPVYISRLNRESVMKGKVFSALEIKVPKVESDQPPESRYMDLLGKKTPKAGPDKRLNSKYLEFVLQSEPAAEEEK